LEVSNQVTAHAEAELLLLKVGRMLGYDTYSPDAGKAAFGENLEDWITLKELPTRFLGAHMIPLVKQIDVIWFIDEVPKVAIEVEHTTKFEAGFQRLLQLQPLSTALLIVSGEANKYLFDKYIKTDPYYKM
jgi:hypothetical protein